MTAPTKTPSTAMTKAPSLALPPAIAAKREEMRERNMMVTAIKGQMWSKEMSEPQMKALAHYCNSNQLDPVRHVEVLGGRVYLKAELYEERGAPLVVDGTLSILPPVFLNNDERLDKLAASGDEWAIEESANRMRARIRWNIPESVKAAVDYPIRVNATGEVIHGVNWCGGTSKKDPVGESEPSKTAITRAGRRAWKQLIEVVPAVKGAVGAAHEGARRVTAEISTIETEMPLLHAGTPSHPTALNADATADDPYALEVGREVEGEEVDA